MYFSGDGVLQSYSEALKWYRRAAEQGHKIAETNLGKMYMNGYGVTQDYARAHMWFNISLANGYEGTSDWRSIAAAPMTLLQIEKAQDMARRCVESDYKDC